MSSGCRLLRRIIKASPDLVCWLDTTHGSGELIENGVPIPDGAVVVVILRDRYATDGSREKRWGGTKHLISYEDSMYGILDKYSGAMVIQYEELCANPKREIGRMAEYLEVPVWDYSKRIYKNRNDKWIQ